MIHLKTRLVLRIIRDTASHTVHTHSVSVSIFHVFLLAVGSMAVSQHIIRAFPLCVNIIYTKCFYLGSAHLFSSVVCLIFLNLCIQAAHGYMFFEEIQNDNLEACGIKSKRAFLALFCHPSLPPVPLLGDYRDYTCGILSSSIWDFFFFLSIFMYRWHLQNVIQSYSFYCVFVC